MKNKLKMASQLLETARDRLVIRGLSDYAVSELPHIGLGARSRAKPRADVYVGNGFPHRDPGRRVSIYLLSLCKVPEGDHEEFFEVRYTSGADPTRWYKSNQIDVRTLRPSITGPPDPTVGTQTYEVGNRLQVWNRLIPPWVSTDDVVVCDQDKNDDHFALCYPSHIRFLMHFTRLHSLLMKRGATTIGAWETEDLIKRLGGFLKARNQDWERVTG